jgi:hypothetical protein
VPDEGLTVAYQRQFVSRPAQKVRWHVLSPWTDEEDIFLSRGFAIFHDEKTNAPDFTNIRERFPFREDRKPSDLADRWRELTDRLEAEDQETITRIKNQAKSHKPQTWTYKDEPQVDLPPWTTSWRSAGRCRRLR